MENKKGNSALINILFLIVGGLSLFLGILLGKRAISVWREDQLIASYTATSTNTSTPLPTATITPSSTPTITPTFTPEPTDTIVLPTNTPTLAVPVDKLGFVDKDITYCTHAGVELKLDIYYPTSYRENAAWPVAMYFHGGGWAVGSKDGPEHLVKVMQNAGFLTVAVDYRLAPDYIFPDFIEDAKCAVRYIRANAKDYNADPSKIGAYGTSAGGHIAALLGTSGNSDFYKTKEWSHVSDAVQVVVSFYGPTHMTELCEAHEAGQTMVYNAYSPTSCYDDDLIYANPMYFADAGDAPTLLLHGSSDYLIPYEQSVFLHEALKSVGVPTSLGRLEGAGHSYLESKNPTPDYIELMLIDYMEKWMGLKEQ